MNENHVQLLMRQAGVSYFLASLGGEEKVLADELVRHELQGVKQELVVNGDWNQLDGVRLTYPNHRFMLYTNSIRMVGLACPHCWSDVVAAIPRVSKRLECTGCHRDAGPRNDHFIFRFREEAEGGWTDFQDDLTDLFELNHDPLQAFQYASHLCSVGAMMDGLYTAMKLRKK